MHACGRGDRQVQVHVHMGPCMAAPLLADCKGGGGLRGCTLSAAWRGHTSAHVHASFFIICRRVRPPGGSGGKPKRLLLFDAFHDIHRGVICLVKVRAHVHAARCAARPGGGPGRMAGCLGGCMHARLHGLIYLGTAKSAERPLHARAGAACVQVGLCWLLCGLSLSHSLRKLH